MMEHVQVVILGGGPAGYNVGVVLRPGWFPHCNPGKIVGRRADGNYRAN